jgi:hypothetical protein
MAVPSVLAIIFARMFDKGGLECCRHNRDGSVQALVLPDSHYSPTSAGQCSIDPLVSVHVAIELGRPVPLVGRGAAPVLGAHVPEAAVDKHSDLTRREDDVGPDLDAFWEAEEQVLPISVSELVQRAAEGNLWLRVGPPVGLHIAGPPGIQRSRVGASSVCARPGSTAVIRHA